MPQSTAIGPCGPRRRGPGGTATERPRRQTDGHGPEGQTGGRGESGRAQLRSARGVLAPSGGWHAVVLAGAVWAVCQEGAPLHPSLSWCQGWSWPVLAGVPWFGLALCALFLRAASRRWPRQVSTEPRDSHLSQRVPPSRPRCPPLATQQGAPFLQAQERTRERPAVQPDSLPCGRSPNGSVPLADALMDSLLLCLFSEALEDPCPAHIRAHADRLEMVMATLGRTGVLRESLKPGGVPGPRGGEEHPLLADTLRGICTLLQQRVLWLRALAKAQWDYGYSMQGVKEVLVQRWALLVQLHIQMILRRRRGSEAEEQVLPAVKKEREGEEDIRVVLQSVERFSVDLAQCKDRLQQSRAHLSDITHLLQDLGASLQALGERGGVELERGGMEMERGGVELERGGMEMERGGAEVEPLWTERLLQSSTQQFEEANQDFLSLQKLTSCFQTHLEGLRAGPHSHPKLSSSARTPAPPEVHPPGTLPRPPCLPRAPPKLPPATTPLSLYVRSAERLGSTFTWLRSSLRKV